MNAVSTRQSTEPSLPEITTDGSNIRRGNNQKSMKPKDSLQTGSVPHALLLSKTEVQISPPRVTLVQKICVEILREGYNRSFSELFSLLSIDRERRAAAEPSSDVRLHAPLEEDQDKLETMKFHLIRAELAEQTASQTVVCDQRMLLGRYFSSPEELWLRVHFYRTCADRGGYSRQATEARACLAELYLQQGELEEARQQAEQCVRQDGGWQDSEGRPLRNRARQSLWKIYNRLADAPLNAEDYRAALRLLQNGHKVAIQTGDRRMEGEASYRVGLAYQRAGDHGRAKEFFSTCIKIFVSLQDSGGLARAYKAMAESLDSERNTLEAVQCLETLVDISSKNGLHRNLADAYLHLGNINSNMGRYQRAYQLFLHFYDVSCQLEDVALLQRAQVLVARARALSMMRRYSVEVESATPAALRRLLAWKDIRACQELEPETTTDGVAGHGSGC